ncbi:MAG: phosphate/phosphite/phosphonate ABC transporter substrate-binding protein [Anaerolineales bacterium]|nr:phosphate/phosphite/phosphonate ABC transporter substrate-binding protein [Anaerolineales bacterium]
MKKIILLLTAFLLISCSPIPQAEIAGHVDLNNLQPLPTPSGYEAVPLRVAVAAVISPKGTVESYSPFLSYLEEKLNRPIELIQRRTYLEINDLIEHGEVDLAFVCTSAYIQGHDTFGMELLVAPQVDGKTTYNSYLIVPTSSSAQSMKDLRGEVFAFTDPISLSGRVYPTFLVQQVGFTPEEFFGRTFYTYSHDEAIRAVASRVADGAAVDSLVYEYAIARDPSLAEKVKIIHRSPDFGIPPVVVSPFTRPQVKAELQSLLLEMADDPTSSEALASIGVERFVLIDDSAYDSVRTLMGSVLSPVVQP